MDEPSRRTMKVDTPHDILFLRANAGLMQELRDDMADSTVVLQSAAAVSRRAREEEMTAAIQSAQQALGASME